MKKDGDILLEIERLYSQNEIVQSLGKTKESRQLIKDISDLRQFMLICF